MDKGDLYELVLDNIPDGIYVLDDKGKYLFVNSAFIRITGMTRAELLCYNVYDHLHRGQINVCISDVVYREKRRVVMFQDVVGDPSRPYRQLVISNPILNQNGEVQNIVAVVKPLATINDYYNEAGTSSVTSVYAATPDREKPGDVIAVSPVMRNIMIMAQTIAEVDSAVLISGESGTGKEVVARFIHERGPRRAKPMVVVNCAVLPENLLEAELFGYEKGAFTGAATGGKAGLFEAADGGTLFLDEINSLPLPLQGKLLRAIETKTIQRLGATKQCKVNFRLITAANEDLREMVEKRLFRSDLFYRLNVIPLLLPPLRERREDIIPLALHFLKYYCERYMKTRLFTEKTIQSMQEYDWPGNVRELKNFAERSVVMTASDYIEIENVQSIAAGRERRNGQSLGERTPPIDIKPPAEDKLAALLAERVSLGDYLARCERDYLQYALKACKSSYETAEALQTSQSLIMRRKKKYGIKK